MNKDLSKQEAEAKQKARKEELRDLIVKLEKFDKRQMIFYPYIEILYY